jgi:tetratricopeptide (TPR) repeat protein/transcriptional regulator with XRE-family HTH domain
MSAHVVRVHRGRLGLSQEDLAALTGLSVRSIQALESGRVRTPRPSTLRLLADALQIPAPDRPAFMQQLASRASAPAGATDGPATPLDADQLPRPAQLPPDLPDFTGRAAVTAELVARLDSPGQPTLATICGMAGVGKTSLAVHVAHLLRDRYPDGQLFVDLRGIGPDPVPPSRAAGAFLRALGVPAGAVPTDPAERTALWRSLVATRSLLVLLDNVHDGGSIASLLPGTGSVAVLVTSREPLAGLPATVRVDLEVFEADECLGLIQSVSGAARVAADPDAALAVGLACGRLPLALRLAAARLAARPRWSLRDLVDRLADGHRRLDELAVPGMELRASLELSYQALSPTSATAFHRFAMTGLDELSVDAMAAALEVDLADATGIAEGLVNARMMTAARAGRYRYHDLVMLFAQEKAAAAEPAEEREQLVRRLVEAHRETAEAAQLAATNQTTDRFRTPDEAWAWLAAEHDLIVAVVERAADLDTPVDPQALTAVAVAVSPYLRTAGEWDEWFRLAETLGRAARRQGHPPGELIARMHLGQLATLRDDVEAAEDHLAAAAALARDLADTRAEARVLNLIGLLRFVQARPLLALQAHEAACKLFTDLGDGAGALSARINIAKALATQGRGEAGLAVIDEATATLTAADDTARVMIWHQMARCQSACGRYDEAITTHRRCLDAVRERGMREGEAYVLAELGLTLVAAGRPEAAREYLEVAVRAFERLGDRNAAGTYQVVLGLAHRAVGNLDRARAAWRRAIRLPRLDRSRSAG